MNSDGTLARRRTLRLFVSAAFVLWGLAVVPTLWRLHAAPASNLGQPVRSLFVVAEASRWAAEDASRWEPPWWDRCDTCSRVESRRTWDEFMELSASGGDAETSRETRIARDVSLAGWGDAPSRLALNALPDEEVAALPDYLASRVDEFRSGAFDAADRRRAADASEAQLAYRGVLILLVVLGLGTLLVLRGRVPAAFSGARAVTPFRLSVLEALAVLFGSFGFAHAAWPGLLSLFGELPFVWPLLPLVPAVPLLWSWSWKRHSPTIGAALASAFGVGTTRPAWFGLAAAVLVGVALELASTELCDATAFAIDWTWRWTDGVDERVFFGDARAVAVTIGEAIFLAPLTEELLFRGVLFSALRRHLPFSVAAIVSAVVFASLHGYGAAGLLSVACAGVVFAWLYEQTQSLLPSVLTHAVANVIALVGAGLLRP